tara:strand:+ start:457 stop:717 length:261 start_codon:yes stop_codon:yes gene_type:complete
MENLSKENISRIIEMAWEDRTPFEAIKKEFNLNESKVIKIMRKELNFRSFKLWRKRVSGRKTKHLYLRGFKVGRHCSHDNNKIKSK